MLGLTAELVVRSEAPLTARPRQPAYKSMRMLPSQFEALSRLTQVFVLGNGGNLWLGAGRRSAALRRLACTWSSDRAGPSRRSRPPPKVLRTWHQGLCNLWLERTVRSGTCLPAGCWSANLIRSFQASLPSVVLRCSGPSTVLYFADGAVPRHAAVLGSGGFVPGRVQRPRSSSLTSMDGNIWLDFGPFSLSSFLRNP